MKLILTKKRGTLIAPFSDELMTFAKSLPSRHKWEGPTLIIETCKANLDHIMTEFEGIEIEDAEGVMAIYNQLPKRKTLKPIDYIYADHAPPPYFFQRDAFNVGAPRHVFAYFIPMGMGKTRIIIDTSAFLYELGLIDQIFILAPNGVHRQWIEEQFPLWLPRRIALRSGFHRAISKIAPPKWSEGLTAYSMNIDAISHNSGERLAVNFLRQGRTLMAVDESIRIKTPASERTASTIKLGRLASYRRILSGAPITKGVQDLYSQFRFLDQDIMGFNTATTFRARYCVYGGFHREEKDKDENTIFVPKTIVGFKNIDELTEKIAPHTMVLDKALLGLPKPIDTERFVTLTKDQRSHYNSFVEARLVEFANGTISDAANAAVVVMRLQQILSGYLPTEDGIEYFPTNRINVLKELLEDIGGKVVIWARFTEEINMIKKALGDRCVTYHGPDKPEQRAINKERFIKDDDIWYFASTTGTGGTGLDGLQTVCSNAIFYSCDDNAGNHWQARDRLDRSGVIGTVVNTYMVARGSPDRKIISSNIRKLNFANEVLANPKILLLEEET